MYQQEGYCSGGNAWNASGLCERGWANGDQLVADFIRETIDSRVIEITAEARVFIALQAVDFLVLTIDITGVFGFDFHLLGNILRHGWQCAESAQGGMVEFRALQKLGHAVFASKGFTDVGTDGLGLWRARMDEAGMEFGRTAGNRLLLGRKP